MANGNGIQLCYLLVLVVAIGFVVYGFMDLLRPKQPNEKSQVDVISRQIRGFALIMVSQIVLIFGAMVCFGMAGGMKQIGAALGKIKM